MKLKRALSAAFVFTLATGVLLAQDSGPTVAHTTHNGPIKKAQETPAQLKNIFTNLGLGSVLYNDTTGYYVLGPNNSVGLSEQWIAVPFIAPANAHIGLLQVAVGYISGTSRINVGLYSDAGGIVGTLLASGHSTNIPLFGSCCQLVNVSIPSTPVAGGAQYWIAATPDDTNGPDFTGVFQASNTAVVGYNEEKAGWVALNTNTPAAAAKGTIP